jgi:twitching motility two-component system response regulator PilG
MIVSHANEQNRIYEMKKIHLSNFTAVKDSKTSTPVDIITNPVPNLPTDRLIMIIDDSSTVRKIFETCLSRAGFSVASFPDGVEAMRWFTEPNARVPDLIFLDIGLPKIDGYEVARRLNAKPQFSNTVIVMVSRRNGIIDMLKGRLAGAKGYLTKPCTTQDILSVVESACQCSSR